MTVTVSRKQVATTWRHPMSKKVIRLTLSAMLFALSFPADAQQPAKVPRIGYVSGTGDPKTPGPQVEALRRGLLDLGYIEGKNIQVEYRYVEGKLDRVPSLVTELVQLQVDVLVTGNSSAIRAARQATKTIPIVMVVVEDPVAAAIIDSLARPGGNITGLTTLARDLSGKRLELLMEVMPGISRVGVLWAVDNQPAALGFKEYEVAARALKTKLQSLGVKGPNPDLESAFQAATKGRVSALITIRDAVLLRYQKQIAELAIKNRLPSMFEGTQ
jgi:putative ABC transport system substrate-binding protein